MGDLTVQGLPLPLVRLPKKFMIFTIFGFWRLHHCWPPAQVFDGRHRPLFVMARRLLPDLFTVVLADPGSACRSYPHPSISPPPRSHSLSVRTFEPSNRLE